MSGFEDKICVIFQTSVLLDIFGLEFTTIHGEYFMGNFENSFLWDIYVSRGAKNECGHSFQSALFHSALPPYFLHHLSGFNDSGVEPFNLVTRAQVA